MTDVLNEAYGLIQCKDCPWYKACAIPMKFTAEDLRHQLEAQNPGASTSMSNDVGLNSLLANMANSAQNTLLEGCPIFIERLRSSPELAQQIKKLMQTWGKDEKLDGPKSP